MVKITFITKDNKSTTLEADSGSVMALAVDNNILGIGGDCGGVCSCATCHVHVQEDQADKIGKASEIEEDMLELDDNTNEFSRLSCQIEISEELDGAVFYVAQE